MNKTRQTIETVNFRLYVKVIVRQNETDFFESFCLKSNFSHFKMTIKLYYKSSSVASAISEGDIFIYSYSAQLISFELDSISKEV